MDIDLTGQLKDLISNFKGAKPNDRSELDRRFAIVITDLEKVYAYTNLYITGNGLLPDEE